MLAARFGSQYGKRPGWAAQCVCDGFVQGQHGHHQKRAVSAGSADRTILMPK
jgi:hypothetical protein